MSTNNFTIQRLHLWNYFRSNYSGKLPQKYEDLEDLIKNSFLRYFGLDQEWLEVNKPKFDFKSFETSVATFVKRIKYWGGKSKCNGYGADFQGKVFMKENLSLVKKNVDADEDEDKTQDKVEEMVQSDQPAFEDFSDRHQRRLAEQLRENNDSEVILKVHNSICSNLTKYPALSFTLLSGCDSNYEAREKL